MMRVLGRCSSSWSITMKCHRRQFLYLAAGAGALMVAARVVKAEGYPIRTVRFVVGFPGGSATDIVARLIAQSLSERLGQQVIVDNRPGAASNIAAEVVVRAVPDGYTLLRRPSNAINATLYDKLNFNFIRDIAPVAGIVRTPTSWWSTHRFRPKPFPSSSPMPRPIQASSTWRRPATGACHMSPANCSR